MKFKIVLIFTIFFSVSSFAQNKKIIDPKTSAPMLLGDFTKDALQDSVFSWWYNSEYNVYKIDSTALNNAEDKLKNFNITLVMGTWCSDSKREVPRFLKILDYLNFPSDKLHMIAVDRTKKSKFNKIDSLNIMYVPTIIFYRDKKEIGRIIEEPWKSLEKDIIQILSVK